MSVSVASNVAFYIEPGSFSEPNPREHIAHMMDYMGDIPDHIYKEAIENWWTGRFLQTMAGYGLSANGDIGKNEDVETLRNAPMIYEAIVDRKWLRTHDKLKAHFNCYSIIIVDRFLCSA